MKAYKETERKYYKYQYSDWTQPSLTSNGVFGVDDFAVQGYDGLWKAFDYDISTSITPQTTTTLQFWYNKNPLKITQLQIATGAVDGYHGATEFSLYGSNDESSWELITTQTTTNRSRVLTTYEINSNSYYKYHKFTTNGSTYIWTALYTINIIGEERVTVESTEVDYDFYKDVDVYKIPSKVERKYYTYQYKDWAQPVLTSDGLLGSDNFAVFSIDGSNAFQAFDESLSTAWGASTTPASIGFYNPNALNVTNISIRNYVNQPYGGYYTSLEGAVYGSNNGVDWDEIQTYTNNVTAYQTYWDIPLNNSNYYKYYKISTTNVNQRTWQITDIKLTATQREVVDGTESNYDIYNDFDIYYGIGD